MLFVRPTRGNNERNRVDAYVCYFYTTLSLARLGATVNRSIMCLLFFQVVVYIFNCLHYLTLWRRPRLGSITNIMLFLWIPIKFSLTKFSKNWCSIPCNCTKESVSCHRKLHVLAVCLLTQKECPLRYRKMSPPANGTKYSEKTLSTSCYDYTKFTTFQCYTEIVIF